MRDHGGKHCHRLAKCYMIVITQALLYVVGSYVLYCDCLQFNSSFWEPGETFIDLGNSFVSVHEVIIH